MLRRDSRQDSHGERPSTQPGGAERLLWGWMGQGAELPLPQSLTPWDQAATGACPLLRSILGSRTFSDTGLGCSPAVVATEAPAPRSRGHISCSCSLGIFIPLFSLISSAPPAPNTAAHTSLVQEPCLWGPSGSRTPPGAARTRGLQEPAPEARGINLQHGAASRHPPPLPEGKQSRGCPGQAAARRGAFFPNKAKWFLFEGFASSNLFK